jgi:trimeric autotransporter adhesin
MVSRLRALASLAACLVLGGCGWWLGEPPKLTLVGMEVTAPPSIPPGVERQLAATGTFTDGAARDITERVTWTSSDLEVATVTDGGLVRSVRPGTATISATDPETSIVGTTSLTITAAPLVSIAVTPTAPSVPVGATARFTATGTYGDGTTQDLTGTVDWRSSAPAIAAFAGGPDATALASTGIAGTVTITAAHVPTGLSGSTLLTVTAAQLVSIAVTPPSASAPVGVTKAFTAVGTYTNGTTQELTQSVAWSSSDPTIATVSGAGTSGGRVTGTSTGAVTIQAADSATHLSGSAALAVTPAVLVSVSVTPTAPSVPLGVRKQLAATGIFSDRTTQDLTAVVTWSSSNGGVASVSNGAGSRGLATSSGIGSTEIRATEPTTQVTGATTLTVTAARLESIAVTPAMSSIPLGLSTRFTAMGTYTNGTTQNLTSAVTWVSSDASIASMSNGKGSVGVASSAAVGTTTINATDAASGITGSTALTVTSARLVSVAVTRAVPSVPVGLTDAFTATGTYTNGTSQDLTAVVTWTSSDAAVASVSNASGSAGVATGATPGTTTIGASEAVTGIAGAAPLTVTPARLISVSVTPAAATVAVGATQQLTATGSYTDATRQDLTAIVTWTSSEPAAAEVSNASGSNGLTTGVATGIAAVEGKDPSTGTAGSSAITVVAQ